ncbi:hypothetical protein C9374_003856 [Naegleria lovaniensis]|uniref:Glycoside hydrolase family 5 domain-containing protein n=1 Tax=Naegleria lovaniensis TaxID=51637 RepID=A0AA88H8N0_NAELO|nr:uncharacterized protein C9374_003856 [Naegleria lovaniensis]KAG2394092.1 hypothetical protein C9374_003856 [Naegleria lovaniensis]
MQKKQQSLIIIMLHNSCSIFFIFFLYLGISCYISTNGHAASLGHYTLSCPSFNNSISFSEWFGTNLPFIFYDPSQYNYDVFIEGMKQLNISHVRIPIHWSVLEPQNGILEPTYVSRLDFTMDKLSKANISSLFFIAGSPKWISSNPSASNYDQYPPTSVEPFILRVKWLLERYAMKGLEIIQIWNEVNLPSFWAPMEDPQAYTHLLNATFTELRNFTHSSFSSHVIQIAMSGMAYFSEMPYHDMNPMFYSLEPLGAFNYCDIVSYHPYYNTPEGNIPQQNVYDFEIKAQLAQQFLSKFGKKIYATEWGWSTYASDFSEQPFITLTQQADYILKRLIMLMYLCFDRVYQFALFDFPPVGFSTRDTYYGIFNASTSAMPNSLPGKPSFYALRNFLNFIGNQHPHNSLHSTPKLIIPKVNDPGNMHSFTVQNSNGDVLWMYWTSMNSSNNQSMTLDTSLIKDILNQTMNTSSTSIVVTFSVYDPIENVLEANGIVEDLNRVTVNVHTTFRVAKFSFSKSMINSSPSPPKQSSFKPKDSKRVSQAAFTTWDYHPLRFGFMFIMIVLTQVLILLEQ